MGWRTIRYGPFTTSSCCSFTCGTLLQLRPSVTRDQMAKTAPRTVTARPTASRASECVHRVSLIQLSGSTCTWRSATPIRTGRYGVSLFRPSALCDVGLEMRHPQAHTCTSAPQAQPNAIRKNRSTALSCAVDDSRSYVCHRQGGYPLLGLGQKYSLNGLVKQLGYCKCKRKTWLVALCFNGIDRLPGHL